MDGYTNTPLKSYDDPPVSMQQIIDTTLLTRKYVLRHFALPRPYIWRKQIISEHPNEEGRINRLIWDTEPWYTHLLHIVKMKY